MSVVQLSDVSLAYGHQPVLRDLNLTVESGQYVVLLGASGCGKTSLLRLIAGFIQPSGGKIQLFEKDVRGVPPRKRKITLVPQSGGLYPHLSIGRSILLGTDRSLPRRQRDEKLSAAAAFVEITDLLDRRPDQLSGGQLRRAALAKAVASDAAIRLFDEPLSAIDAHLRFRIETDLRRVHSRMPGATLHVTHDGSEAVRLADKIGVIENGKIVQFDSPQHVLQHPNTPHVAAALGTSPLITIEVRRNNERWIGPESQRCPVASDQEGIDVATIAYYQNDALPLRSDGASSENDFVDPKLGILVPRSSLKWFSVT